MARDTKHVVEGAHELRPAWAAGKEVKALTAEKMIKEAGLDWEVALEQMYRKNHDGKYVAVPGKKLVVRQDTEETLAPAGSDYVEFQNREVFTFADGIVDDGGAKYHTAGSLRGGKWIWALMAFPKDIKVAGVDPYNQFLLLATSHDGSKKITAANVFNRVFCMNTFNLALSTASHTWAIRHTKTAKAQLQMAREALQLTFAGVDEFQQEMEALVKQKMTVNEYDQFIDKLLAGRFKEKALAEAKEKLQAGFKAENLANVRGTRYAALQAVGEYFEHDPSRVHNPEGKFISTMMGTAKAARNQAFTLLSA